MSNRILSDCTQNNTLKISVHTHDACVTIHTKIHYQHI